MKQPIRPLSLTELSSIRGGKRTEVKDSHDRYAGATSTTSTSS